MNKKASIPLTYIFIGSICSITAFTLLFSAYLQFNEDNNLDIEDNYTQYYSEIDSYKNQLYDSGEELQDKNLLTSVWEGATGTLGVFVTGLAAITKLFELIPIFKMIIQTAAKAIPGFEALFGLLTIIVIIYISMSFVKSRRGTSDLS